MLGPFPGPWKVAVHVRALKIYDWLHGKLSYKERYIQISFSDQWKLHMEGIFELDL